MENVSCRKARAIRALPMVGIDVGQMQLLLSRFRWFRCMMMIAKEVWQHSLLKNYIRILAALLATLSLRENCSGLS